MTTQHGRLINWNSSGIVVEPDGALTIEGAFKGVFVENLDVGDGPDDGLRHRQSDLDRMNFVPRSVVPARMFVQLHDGSRLTDGVFDHVDTAEGLGVLRQIWFPFALPTATCREQIFLRGHRARCAVASRPAGGRKVGLLDPSKILAEHHDT